MAIPMGKRMRLLVQSTGLNNKSAPTRIAYDAQKGVVELSEAYNVEIDDDGRPCRRKGFTSTVRTEASHSLFAGKTDTYFVAGTTFYRLNKDFTRTAIATGLTADAVMEYVELLNTIYYMNGHQIGTLVNGKFVAWTVGTYYGPPTIRQFSGPPTGSLLEVYNGSMFIAAGNVLWFSERFGFNLFDMARNYIWMDGDIKMVKAVSDGIYVSTEKKVVFFKGSVPSEFEQKNVSGFPAIKGIAVKVNAENILNGQIVGDAVLWTSVNGIYLGLSGGECRNMTTDKITLPQMSSGSAIFYNGKYIVTLKK
jgi:hypothetical protein